MQAFGERVLPLVRELEQQVAGSADPVADLGLAPELASSLEVLVAARVPVGA